MRAIGRFIMNGIMPGRYPGIKEPRNPVETGAGQGSRVSSRILASKFREPCGPGLLPA
jgi:hypothetical protein